MTSKTKQAFGEFFKRRGKAFWIAALGVLFSLPLSAGYVTYERGSGGGASSTHVNNLNEDAQSVGYPTDALRDAAIALGYGNNVTDADIFMAARGETSNDYPTPHALSTANGDNISANQYEEDCDYYILVTSSVTGDSCADLTKTQFLSIKTLTEDAIEFGYDSNQQRLTATGLGYADSCDGSDLFHEARGQTSGRCNNNALSPPQTSDCTSYISAQSLNDASGSALSGCPAMTSTQYQAFKTWSDTAAAENAILTATSCSDISNQQIKLFMQDQSVSNSAFDFANLSVKQGDFLSQCILDQGTSRTIAQAKSCGSAKTEADLALYELKQIRAAGAAGCGTAGNYPTADLTTGLMRRAGIWNTSNDSSCSSAYGGNFCDSSGNTVSCTSVLQSTISAANASDVASATAFKNWATAKVKANLQAQWSAWTPPHLIAEACQSATWPTPAFLQSPALKPIYSTHLFNGMVAAPASNIHVYDGTGSPHTYKNMVVVGQDGANFRMDIAANVEKRRMRYVQITNQWVNNCPAFGTTALTGAKKMAYSVVKNNVDAAANTLTAGFKPVQVESPGYLCSACQGSSPPEYCDPALSLGTANLWHTNNTQINSASGNVVCSGKSLAGQIGGADWTQPSSVGNLYKCVNTGCDNGQPDTYDTTLRCNVPYAGYNGSSYGNYTVAVGAASGAKKNLTVSGQVAETGSMQVEWCDGTRSIVPTAASGSIHVWSVTSPTPMGSSTVKIRLDTSNAIGKVSQITAQYPNSFFGSCD